MAKKLQVNVDAGDIIDSFRPELPPAFPHDAQEPPAREAVPPEPQEERKTPSSRPKEKKAPACVPQEAPATESEYLGLFIRDPEMSARSGKLVYVRKDYHDRILRIIQVIGKNELSLSGYIDHVLTHHFTQYEEVIKKLYKKFYEEVY
jgi:hypothetical protein